MKKIITLLFLILYFLFSQNLNRQIKIESFDESSEIINPEKDKALIIIRSQIPDLVFDANRNIDVKPQSGSVWHIYFTPGTIRLKVSSKGFEQLDIPPKSFSGGRAYLLRLVAAGFAPNITETLFEVVFQLNQDQVYTSYANYSPVLSKTKMISYKLPKGEYTFRFQKNGFTDVLKTVTVDQSQQISIDLQQGISTVSSFALPGLIVIESNPSGAEILIDGQKLGVTPFQGDITAGTHQVEVRKSLYYPSVSTFTLKEGETQSIPVTLKPRFGYIEISSTPSNAKITMDGKLYGTTPSAKQSIESGSHTITIGLDLYYSYTEQFIIVDGQGKNITAKLKPAFGTLVVNSLPESSAAVFLDDKKIGATPFVNKKLPSGKYLLKVTKPLFADIEEEILIEDEKTTTKQIILPQKFGTLTVNAPQSKIFLDGKSVAQNLYYAKMNPGRYTVRAERNNQYIPAEKEVFISVGSGEIVKLEPTPRVGSVSVFVEPFEAKDAEIYVNDKLQGNAPKVLSLLIDDYTITAKKDGFLDFTETVTIKERESAKLNLKMSTYEGSLQSKRDTWGTYKWISAAVAVGAGAAAVYFNSKANSYYTEYHNANTAALAASKRNRVEESKLYNNISLGCAIGAGVSFLITWGEQGSF